MKMTISDLRRRTKDVVRALDRNEHISLLYRGKLIGVIAPPPPDPAIKVQDHPLFGIQPSDVPVEKKMEILCRPRYRV